MSESDITKDQEIERLKALVKDNAKQSSVVIADLQDAQERISTLEALLERVPHHTKQMGYFMNPDIYKFICFDDCPRCAYEKLKGAQ